MGRKEENTAFTCLNCGLIVTPVTNGGYRNHCPHCFYSKHVDIKLGDRLNTCNGLMKPIDWRYSSKKGYQVVHQCTVCRLVKCNKLAANTEQEDQLMALMHQLNSNS
ncbi:RNHCP domain-containing protein [Amphibacillus marinus]|uniref:RNHCP domain-containing protein n=1 Tax=Amphibacillus marinus TaxID=872970 RepID=A0A1H8K859_9BACI|nr:RNHCP domain-containing protein [Amphibacillus marinus]SEN88881.1 RNHCP domain-containing protein [Amphibacillus marinus]